MNLFTTIIEGINVCLFVTFLILIESVCIYAFVFVCFNILSYTKRKYCTKKNRNCDTQLENIIGVITHSTKDKRMPEQHVASDDENEMAERETNMDDRKDNTKNPS